MESNNASLQPDVGKYASPECNCNNDKRQLQNKKTPDIVVLCCSECGYSLGYIARGEFSSIANIYCYTCALDFAMVNERLGTNFYPSVKELREMRRKTIFTPGGQLKSPVHYSTYGSVLAWFLNEEN